MTNTFVGFCSATSFQFRTDAPEMLTQPDQPRVQVFAIAILKDGTITSLSVVYGVIASMVRDGTTGLVTVHIAAPHEAPAIELAVVITNQTA